MAALELPCRFRTADHQDHDNENFKEHSESIGPSKEIENLDGRMELFDSFRSMKVDW